MIQRKPAQDPIDLLQGPDYRIWITHLGDLKASEKTHGSCFMALYAAMREAGEAPADLNPFWWMQATLGSVPPEPDTAEWDDEDNPGWQYNEFAVRVLGWIRVTTDRWLTNGKLEIDIAYDGAVVASRAVDTLIAFVKKAESEFERLAIEFDMVRFDDVVRAKAELRDLRREAAQREKSRRDKSRGRE